MIYLFGNIDDKLALYIVRKLNQLESQGIKEIDLYINSNGGEVESAYAIIDYMQILKNRGILINTIGLGKVYSAAALILAYGSKRYATIDTTIMLHPIYVSLPEDNVDSQKSSIDFSHSQYREMMWRFAKQIGKADTDEVLNDIKDSLWLNMKQALNWGIIEAEWTGKRKRKKKTNLGEVK